VQRSAHTGRTLLYQRFCAAKRTHRQDASIPTLLCSEAHRPIAWCLRKSKTHFFH